MYPRNIHLLRANLFLLFYFFFTHNFFPSFVFDLALEGF